MWGVGAGVGGLASPPPSAGVFPGPEWNYSRLAQEGIFCLVYLVRADVERMAWLVKHRAKEWRWIFHVEISPVWGWPCLHLVGTLLGFIFVCVIGFWYAVLFRGCCFVFEKFCEIEDFNNQVYMMFSFKNIEPRTNQEIYNVHKIFDRITRLRQRTDRSNRFARRHANGRINVIYFHWFHTRIKGFTSGSCSIMFAGRNSYNIITDDHLWPGRDQPLHEELVPGGFSDFPAFGVFRFSCV